MGKNPEIPPQIIPVGSSGIPDLGRPRCNHQGWICPTVLIPTLVPGGRSKGFWGKVKDFFKKPMVTIYLTQNAICLNPVCNMIFTFGPAVAPPADGGKTQPGTPEVGKPAGSPSHN